MNKLIANFIVKQTPWTFASSIGRLPFMTEMFQYIFYKHFTGPKSVKIHINSDCNYDCKYCYVDRKQQSLSTDKWLSFIDELTQYNIHTIEISGGEPFLYKDLTTILKKCAKNVAHVTIYTNGSLIDREWIKRLKSLNIDIIISVKYDFPQTYRINTSNTGDLKTVERNVKMLVENNIPVVAFITVTKPSVRHIKSTLNRALFLGAFPAVERYVPVKDKNTNSVLRIQPKDWLKAISYIKHIYSDYASMIDGVNRIQGCTCSCYKTQISVLQNGDVVPCQFVTSGNKIGNVKKQKLPDIWKTFYQKRKEWMKIPPECKKCPSKAVCSGGCRSYAFFINGDYEQKDPLCCSKIPTTIGHCAFTVIHSLENNKITNEKLKEIP